MSILIVSYRRVYQKQFSFLSFAVHIQNYHSPS